MENIPDRYHEKIRKHHGDKYDYSYSVANSSKTKIKIICPIHGEFHQRIDHHSCGHGCKKCSVEVVKFKCTKTKEQFVQKAREVHGDKYDYTKSVYTNALNKLIIKCNTCSHLFDQTAASHCVGRGCPKCAQIIKNDSKRKSRELFIEQANIKHSNQYSYEKCDYFRAHKKVIITCSKHGDFEQTPDSHTNGGKGCPKCVNKRYITNHIRQANKILNGVGGLSYELEKTKLIPGKRYRPDLYFTDKNVAVDFHGEFWHCEKFGDMHQTRDKILHFRQQNIDIFTFFWSTIVTGRHLGLLRRRLGIVPHRILSSECSILSGDFTKFIKNNNFSGHCYAKNCVALGYKGTIVMSCAFRQYHKDYFNLVETATHPDFDVDSGLSRICNEFRRKHNKSIVAISDNMRCDGSIYKDCNFTKIGTISQNYWYVKQKSGLINRSKFSKEKIQNIKNFYYCKDSTVHQNCNENGYYRVYDAGKCRWILE